MTGERSPLKTRQLRKSWLVGFFARTATRVAEAHKTSIAQTDGGAALVLVGDADRAKQGMKDAYPKTTMVKNRSYDRHAMAKGREAGETADIGNSRLGSNRLHLNS